MAQRLEIIISAKDQASRTFGSITGNMQKIGKIALGVTAGGLAAVGAGIIGLATKAVPAASDVTESMNAVNKVFEESAQTVIAWGDKAATQAGLAKSEFFQMSAQTGAMLQNLGIDQSKAAEESVNLAQRAADMASIFNTDVSEALGAIQAGLRGEADPLERFGVRLNAAAVAAKAVEMGLAGSTKEVDDAARAQAALALLYEQTDKLAGDFVDTSGDLANAQRVAGAQWQNFLATIGKIGLPILGKFFNLLSTSVLPVLYTFAQYIGFVVDEGDTLNDFLADLPGWLQPIARTIGEIIVAAQEFVSEFIRGFEATGDPIAAFMEALDNILPEQTIEKIWAFIDAVNNIISVVGTAIDPIVKWAQENVKFQDVLVAVGIAILSVVIPAVVSLIATILPVIATFAAIVAAVTLLRKAWETNFLGIQDKTKAAWEAIQPLLQQAWNWLQENIPIALETLRAFWVDKAWPAIQSVVETVWPVIQGIFTALKSFILDILVPTINNLYTLWTVTVWPTIQTVTQNVWTVISEIFGELGRWINDNIIPWIEYLQKVWEETVWPAIQTAVENVWTVIEPIWNSLKTWMETTIPTALGSLQTKFENVMSAIDTAIQPVKNLWSDFVDAVKGFWNWISSKVFNFKINLPDLPDWAIPGSPLPIHTAWKDFARDLSQMAIRPKLDFVNLAPMMGTANSTGSRSGTIINQEWKLIINEAGRIVDPAGSMMMLKALAGV